MGPPRQPRAMALVEASRFLSPGTAFHAPSVSATASPPPSDHPRLLRPSLHLWLSFITAAATTTTQHRTPVLRILPPSSSPARLGAVLQPLGIGMTTHRFASPALSKEALPPLSPQHGHPMPPLTTLPKTHPRRLHANLITEQAQSDAVCRLPSPLLRKHRFPTGAATSPRLTRTMRRQKVLNHVGSNRQGRNASTTISSELPQQPYHLDHLHSRPLNITTVIV